MAVHTVMTLERLCLVPVAISVCSSSVVRELEKTIVSSFLDSDEWKSLICKKLSRYLVLPLSKRLTYCIKPICFEITMWKTNHFEILGSSVHNPIDFFWDSMGTIDHLKTAKRLVHCHDLTLPQRFAIACHYCMVTEAQRLWNKASESEKNFLMKLAKPKEEVYYKSPKEIHTRITQGNAVLRFWIDWLQEGTKNEHDCEYFHSTLLWNRYIPVLSHLVQTLTSEEAVGFFSCRMKWNYRINNNERFFLSNLRLVDRTELFKTQPFEILVMHLQWPLQIEFIRMADCLWSHLTKRNFLDMLFVIVCEKINKQWKDYDYFELIREFWHRSPENFKQYVVQSNYFPCFEIYL